MVLFLAYLLHVRLRFLSKRTFKFFKLSLLDGKPTSAIVLGAKINLIDSRSFKQNLLSNTKAVKYLCYINNCFSSLTFDSQCAIKAKICYNQLDISTDEKDKQ